MQKIAIVLASGSGKRMSSGILKQYIKLKNGLSVLDNTLTKLLSKPFFDLIIVVVNNLNFFYKNSYFRKVSLCVGGTHRSTSLMQALIYLRNSVSSHDWIFIHDGVRPFISFHDIENLFNTVEKTSSIGGVLVERSTDTLKRVNSLGFITSTINRAYVANAQTPQLFQYEVLLNSLKNCQRLHLNITDESYMVEITYKKPIISVLGSRKNIKITYPEDIEIANSFVNN